MYLTSKMKRLFSRRPEWKPSKKEIKDSFFVNIDETKEIPRKIQNLVETAYMAGEKAAQEGSNSTDMTKLIAIGVAGLMAGVLIAQSGLLPM